MAKQFLRRRLVECADGGEALAAYDRWQPDWVLMDIELGGMDGITATRQIIEAFPEARVIIVTNHNDEPLRVAAREALARGEVAGVIAAGGAMVEERAAFGTPEDVADQLRRYDGVIDWAILYPPHFGVDPDRIHANELSLIDVASGWTS